jgi:hypothetical protein
MSLSSLQEVTYADTAAPAQADLSWEPSYPKTPERTLLLAMLAQAANDLQRCRLDLRRRGRRIYSEAYRWVMSNDRSHPFSFVNVCEALQLSPVALRRGMVAKAPVPRFPRI